MWKAIKKFFSKKREAATVEEKSLVEHNFDVLSQKVEADQAVIEKLRRQTKKGMLEVEKAIEKDAQQVDRILETIG